MDEGMLAELHLIMPEGAASGHDMSAPQPDMARQMNSAALIEAYWQESASGPPRKLVAVAVAMAGRTEMHETAKDGAMSTMKPVGDVPIASGETVRFAPGGYHVMLFDLDPRLRFEKTARLTLTFDNGDKAAVAAPVTTVGEAMGDMG